MPPKNQLSGESPHPLGARLREARKRLRLTLQDLGRRVEISYQSLSKIERGVRFPPVALLSRLARELGVDEGWLLHGTGYLREVEAWRALIGSSPAIREVLRQMASWPEEKREEALRVIGSGRLEMLQAILREIEGSARVEENPPQRRRKNGR